MKSPSTVRLTARSGPPGPVWGPDQISLGQKQILTAERNLPAAAIRALDESRTT